MSDMNGPMYGSHRECFHCGAPSSSFIRNHVARAIQCVNCRAMIEERASSLIEHKSLSQSEEILCVVTPDFVTEHVLPNDLENDPYITRNFITAFRNLVPVMDPVYFPSSRTFSGELVEMERIIGDAVYSGYVGYNGRALRTAPGSMPLNSTSSASAATAGDTRHTIVAYFLISDAAMELNIPNSVVELAVYIFRRVLGSLVMRNRPVETLAAASLICAIERAKHRKDVIRHRDVESILSKLPDWKDVCLSMNENSKDVEKYLILVNQKLQKGKAKPSSTLLSMATSMGIKLKLPETIQERARSMLTRIIELGVCSRRNAVSICAGALFLSAQTDDRVKRTQSEVAKCTGTSEVTLRKVCREIIDRMEDIEAASDKNGRLYDDVKGDGESRTVVETKDKRQRKISGKENSEDRALSKRNEKSKGIKRKATVEVSKGITKSARSERIEGQSLLEDPYLTVLLAASAFHKHRNEMLPPLDLIVNANSSEDKKFPQKFTPIELLLSVPPPPSPPKQNTSNT
eukprot:CAMPEP_0182448010 /NCGR_PEP_ID=MMETSP1172-20130603/22647_1 /TAXON_ID=708627 /ORGANISM="Timspurckia oligopyrenoides, Strain CCMP3278" /LENGTH=517 /DNA_ID=CAMNT_0024644701 /DNA_START=1 /DNA_END=1554 /DNA_ORIENTATION=+